jgi:predicted O-linked N-acetylglucosamine transferase (SPINDLY family)
MNTLADETFQRAVAAMQSGELATAKHLFGTVLGEQPGHVGSLNLLGVTLMRLGEYADAENYLRRALRANAKSDATLYNLGLVLKAVDRPAEALEAFNHALAINRTVAETWNNRGTVLNGLGRCAEAIADFDQAIRINSRYAEAYYNKGKSLTVLKRIGEAGAAFESALSQNPNLAEAWYGRGSVLCELGWHTEGLADLEKALVLKPAFPEALISRGNAYRELSRWDDALAAFERALVLNAHLVDAVLGRGNAFAGLKRYDEALATFDTALALVPDLVGGRLGRGDVFFLQERYEEALAEYGRAIEADVGLAEAWLGCGNAYYAVKRYNDALLGYDRALAMKPAQAVAWQGRGNVLFSLDRFDEALIAYDQAIALKADLAEAWHGRGCSCIRLSRYNDALAALDQALALKKDFAEAWHTRAVALVDTNRTAEAFVAFDKALSIKPDLSTAISAKIFALDFAANAGFEEQWQARCYWWERIGSKIAERTKKRQANSVDPTRRIRVGYVSGDFRKHSAARSFRPMLQNHDKSQFEITCYSCTPREDEVTADFRRAADRWRNVAQASDDELYAQIQADEIDILVDLSGYTVGHRLAVFARAAAPIQVSAGATGTGMPTVDYLFSDPVLCPAAVRHLFAEKIFDLPCIMTIEPPPLQLRPSDPPILSKGYITFGVFNRISKISDEVMSLWANLLHAVPNSRLLMKHIALDDPSVRSRQLDRLAALGIAEGRIGLLGGTSREEHLAAFKDVDISLDPFPHNGGISTLESLQMGVPVVAKLGNSISSRAAGAILSSIGLTDWVAETAEDYPAIAIKFSSMPSYLKTLRYEFPAKVSASAVGNPALYTRAVEAAYRKMWADYCRSPAAAQIGFDQ